MNLQLVELQAVNVELLPWPRQQLILLIFKILNFWEFFLSSRK